MDFLHQRLQLRQVVEIAGEQDHAAHLRMAKDLALFRAQCIAADAQHDLPERHGLVLLHSRIRTGVYTGTRSNSSMSSALRMRMQPAEPGTPMRSVSGQPWM